MLSSWTLILPLNFSWGLPSPWSSQLLFSITTSKLPNFWERLQNRIKCFFSAVLLHPPGHSVNFREYYYCVALLKCSPESQLPNSTYVTFLLTALHPFPPPLQIFFVLPLFSFCLTAPEVLSLWYLTWPSLQPFFHSISSHLPALLSLFISTLLCLQILSVPSNGRERTSQQTEVTLPWFYKPFRLLISWLHFQ